MARPSKYPVRHYVRLSHKTDKQLSRRARAMGLTPGEVLRIMTEHALTPVPTTEAGKAAKALSDAALSEPSK